MIIHVDLETRYTTITVDAEWRFSNGLSFLVRV